MIPKRLKTKEVIIFENEDFVVVNKPAGWLSIPDRYDIDKPNLFDWLKTQYENIIPVHRLDKNTSGVMLFARDAQWHRAMNIAFEERKVTKTYQALVNGSIKEKSGQIEVALKSVKSNDGTKMIASKGGKASSTTYLVIMDFNLFTLVEYQPKSGRTHQIRAHSQYLGNPIVGDVKYGGGEGFFLSKIKGKRYNRGKERHEERPLIGRTALHSSKIGFINPKTNEKMLFEAPLPKDISAGVYQLTKWRNKIQKI